MCRGFPAFDYYDTLFTPAHLFFLVSVHTQEKQRIRLSYKKQNILEKITKVNKKNRKDTSKQNFKYLH